MQTLRFILHKVQCCISSKSISKDHFSPIWPNTDPELELLYLLQIVALEQLNLFCEFLKLPAGWAGLIRVLRALADVGVGVSGYYVKVLEVALLRE